jgi:hypothetical protein
MVREIKIQIERVEIKARPRRLECRKTVRKGNRKFVYKVPVRWTCEPMRDIVCHHDVDSLEEISKFLSGAV